MEILKRIEQRKAQIERIKQIEDKGEHLAAGLSIDLGVGVNDENCLSLEVSWDTEGVLRTLRNSLELSLAQAQREAHRQLREMQAAVGAGPSPAALDIVVDALRAAAKVLAYGDKDNAHAAKLAKNALNTLNVPFQEET